MRIQKQLFRHDPANGVFGDCHRTAIACILNLNAVEVPHFMDGLNDEPAGDQHRATERWLNERGITQIQTLYSGDASLQDVLNSVASVNHHNGVVFMLGGTSRNGTGHSVVCCDGEIVCDPSLDDSGIVGPMSDGWWWVTFFGALIATTKQVAPLPRGTKGGPTESDPDRPYCKPDQSCCDFCCGN